MRNTPFYAVILWSLLFTACERKIKPQQAVESTNPPTVTPPVSADVDPYFTPTKLTNSAYGPSNITRNILKDRNGYIWLATWEGIIRYDGTTFTNFTNKDSLRNYHVFCLLEDSKGILWFGTIGAGVYRYDPTISETGGTAFTNITVKDGLAHDGLISIYEDKAGNIWFGTQEGASCYDGKSFRNFTMKDGLPNNNINAMLEDQSGILWFGNRGEACMYGIHLNEAVGQGKTFIRLMNEDGKTFGNVRSIIEDKRGYIWFGGNDGLWRYDPKASSTGGKSFSNFTKNFVGYIFEDSKGNIWTSSASDDNPNKWVLTRYKEKSLLSDHPIATQVKVEENMFFGIEEDKEGGIWLGHLRGVYRYDGQTFDNFQKKEVKE